MKQQADDRGYAMLACGDGNGESFVLYAPPFKDFANDSLALYEAIREQQTKVLGAGMKADEQLL